MILLALIWPILDVNNWVKNTNDESQSFFFGLKVTKYTSSARCILIVRQTRKKVLSRSSKYNYIQVQKQKTNKIQIQITNTIQAIYKYNSQNTRQTKYKYKVHRRGCQQVQISQTNMAKRSLMITPLIRDGCHIQTDD